MAVSMPSLDKACFLGDEALIQGHVPFDLSKDLVHPVRIAIATVRSICNHNHTDWFEGAIKLLEFIHFRHEDVNQELYSEIISKIKRMAVLAEVATNVTITTDSIQRIVYKYFPSENDHHNIMVDLMDSQRFHQVMQREFTDKSHITLLEEYFKRIEEELPSPFT